VVLYSWRLYTIMTLAFAIRDVGINHFTDPDDLAAAYAGYDLPVSLACVPFQGHTRSPALPESEWSGAPDERFPLAEHDALVDHVHAGVETGAYSVLLNGYDGVRTPAGPEFTRGGDLNGKVEAGRAQLEGLFGPVSVFVPPDDRLHRAGFEAVKTAGLDTLYYPTPRHRPHDLETARTLARDVAFKFRHRTRGLLGFGQDLYRHWALDDRSVPLAVRPFPYYLDGAWEFTPTSLLASSNLARLERQVALADRLDGGFCLAVAHWRLEDDRFREKFEALVEHARDRHDARFVHVAELFP
jgi:hypothetical protein